MIGETVKDFTVTSRLGKGGMGEVFLAEHRIVKTKVAIKMLLADVSQDRQHVQRFFNEAIAVSKIRHSGIVKIFDVGFHTDGRAYLIMEYLEGESLSSRIQGRPLLQEQVAELTRQIASVLQATHAAGITHRDLKPDNLFLVPDAELASGERVKVLDFGIAKLVNTTGTGMTATGNTMGTPGYMAPEQWNDASKADALTDIYSLGCLVFEMYCGRLPFVAASIGEACTKHLTATPPRARTLVPSLPTQIDDLIARMLSKSASDRPSMKEVGAVFSAIAASAPVLGAALPPAHEASSPSPEPLLVSATTLGAASGVIATTRKSRRSGVIVGALAIAAVGSAVGIMAVHGGEPPPAPPAASRDTPASVPGDAALRTPIPAVSPVDTSWNTTRFTTVHHVDVQVAQVSRAEYGAYLAHLPPSERDRAQPLRGWVDDHSPEPVSWVTFEQAKNYCTAIGGRLLTRERWVQASGGTWGISTGTATTGPLREWSSTITPDGLALVMGGHARMTDAQRANAAQNPLAKDTQASAGPNPAAERVASATIGIRCGR